MTKKSASRKARDAEIKNKLFNRQLSGTAAGATTTRMSPAKRLAARSNFNNRVNTCWDDTNKSKEMIRQSLGHCAAVTKTIIEDKSIVPFVDDQTEYAQRVVAVTQDINQLVEDYELATKAHDGKVGGSKNPDEVMEAIQINELYFSIQNKLANVVHPMLSSIAASAGVARTRQAYAIKQSLEEKRNEGTLDASGEETLALVTEVTTGLEAVSAEMEAARTAAIAPAEEVAPTQEAVAEVSTDAAV